MKLSELREAHTVGFRAPKRLCQRCYKKPATHIVGLKGAGQFFGCEEHSEGKDEMTGEDIDSAIPIHDWFKEHGLLINDAEGKRMDVE